MPAPAAAYRRSLSHSTSQWSSLHFQGRTVVYVSGQTLYNSSQRYTFREGTFSIRLCICIIRASFIEIYICIATILYITSLSKYTSFSMDIHTQLAYIGSRQVHHVFLDQIKIAQRARYFICMLWPQTVSRMYRISLLQI